ncbi:MAG: hypothetical protein AAB974_01515 [Patescibacteria group bacterium]
MFIINCPCLLSHDSDTCSRCKGLGVAAFQWGRLRPLTDEELLAACEASVETMDTVEIAQAA